MATVYATTDEEIEAIFYAEDLKHDGFHIASQMQRARQDDIWFLIVARGFRGELADQIYARWQKREWDYTTPAGSVISNIVFPTQGVLQEEPYISGEGREDLPYSALAQITSDTLVRPKLPGKLMTQADVRALGRRTCYSLVERVGDTLYGLYPDVKQCECCQFNSYVRLCELVLEDWHEGIMVKIADTEYRTRRFKTLDMLYKGAVWEMEYKDDLYVPVKPRGKGKYPQKEKEQVTSPMVQGLLHDDATFKVKRWMTKAIVWTRSGFHFHNQHGVWDMVGGKQELLDKEPDDTMRREYKEEVGKPCPRFFYLDYEETRDFMVHYYLIKDLSLSSSYDPSLLKGIQRLSFDKAISFYKQAPHLAYASEYSLQLFKKPGGTKAEKERKQKIIQADKHRWYETVTEMNLPLGYFLPGGIKGYLLPLSQQKVSVFRKLLSDGLSEVDALRKLVGEALAVRICGGQYQRRDYSLTHHHLRVDPISLIRKEFRRTKHPFHPAVLGLDMLQYSNGTCKGIDWLDGFSKSMPMPFQPSALLELSEALEERLQSKGLEMDVVDLGLDFLNLDI